MKRILVIDDDLALLDMIHQWLLRADYETVTATSVSQGLEEYKKLPFDLVISDVFLPDRNGVSLLMEIHEIFPRAKVVMMSGGGGRIDYLKFASVLGAKKILQKPFERDFFLNTVQKAVH